MRSDLLTAAIVAAIVGCAAPVPNRPALTAQQAVSLARALSVDDPAAQARLFGPGSNGAVAEGDHYRVTLPLGSGEATEPALVAAPTTLRARPLDGQRWLFDALTLPRVISKAGPRPFSVRLDTEGLAYRATTDPSHATESASALTWDSARIALTGTIVEPGKPDRPLDVALTTGRLQDHATTGVLTDGRVDQTDTVSIAGVGLDPAKGSNATTVGRFDGTSVAGGVSPERMRAMRSALVAFNAVPDASAKPAWTSAQRAGLSRLIDVVGDTLRSSDMTYELTGVAFTTSARSRVNIAKSGSRCPAPPSTARSTSGSGSRRRTGTSRRPRLRGRSRAWSRSISWSCRMSR